MEIEIICNGIVHYRRPEGDRDIAEFKSVVSRGYAQSYSIREVKEKENGK